MTDNQEPLTKNNNSDHPPLLKKLKRWQWWLLVSINIFFLIAGQCAAVLLGRFYYDQGGNSKWMATLVQTAAFPLLLIPFFLIPNSNPSSNSNPPSLKIVASIYIVLGVIIAGDNMLYSIGLLHLSASTYSLICASQLAFNAVFSYFLNSQKFTSLILDSVAMLSFSSALIATNDDSSSEPSGNSKLKYAIGFLTTLAASALYSLILSLMQLSFQKVIRKETFAVVLEMQIYTSAVATCVSTAGLFISGEWKTISTEMGSYEKGRSSYVLTLVWTAVAWQVCSVGVVGLIFVVSSLFSNVISTVALAVSPISAVIVFRDKMNGVKVIALLMAVWGFGCYSRQNYLDECEIRRRKAEEGGTAQDSHGGPLC
ncbi:Probable purine permease 11 [Linum perenne]